MNSDRKAVPKLLVSVRNAEEVRDALTGGADWIDLKEPNAGPLAAVDVQVAREAAQALAGRRTLSAALGELREWETSSAAELLAVPEISVVKIGLAGCACHNNWQQQWTTLSEQASTYDKQLVAVIYADRHLAKAPTPEEIMRLAQNSSCRYLLVDTFDKSAGSTFDHFSNCEIEEILHQAKQFGMTTVLAGSITLETIASVPSKDVDMLAVRGAVCCGDRTAKVDAELVASFRHAVEAQFGKSLFSSRRTS